MDFIAKMTYSNSIKWGLCGFFLILSIQIQAQQKIDGLTEAVRVEKRLGSMEPDTSKINRLLELAEFYRILEPKSQTNTNKAVRYVNNAIAISQKKKFPKGMGSSYLIFSRIEQDRQDFKKTIHFAKKALGYFEPIKEYNLMGESQVMEWSGSTLLQNPVEERATLLKEACVSFGKANNKSRQGDCMKELGDLYQFHRRFSEALPVLKQALDYYIASGRKDLFGIYDLLGAVYTSLGDYKEGLRYGLLAVGSADQLDKNGTMLCAIFNRIGTTYFFIRDYPKAIKYYQKALDIAIRNKDMNGINLMYAEITTILTFSRKYKEAKVYLDRILKKYPELIKIDPVTPTYFYLDISHSLGYEKTAANYFRTLEKLLNTKYFEIAERRPNVFEIIINYLIDIRDSKKAAYYNNIYHQVMDSNNLGKSAGVYHYQFKIDSISGNYLSAIKDLQALKKVDEKTSNEQTSRQINQLNILYETEKKNRNILQLTKANELQQQNLQQARKMRNITFIVLALLVIILLLSIHGYYQKKKTNELLQKKQEVINDANKSLRHLVHEKEWLLREIHHRVKNNLHMISGLLASQTEFIEGEEALDAISDSQHRVQAMSIIHQKLYQTDTLSHINMSTYISELTEYLNDSLNGKCAVKFKLDIEQVDFPLSYSIPVGLIINEAVTNSIKYAFDVCGDCFISIFLKNTQGNDYILRIRDNGVGMADNFNISETNSLGMRLIEGLSNDIHADLKMYNNNGSVIEISFTIQENYTQKSRLIANEESLS